MHEQFRYRDSISRKVRVCIDENGPAWVRQEFRRGKWWTMERHPMESLESVQNEPGPDDEAREVPA